MKEGPIIAAQRLQLLLEEFSPRDLADGLSLLKSEKAIELRSRLRRPLKKPKRSRRKRAPARARGPSWERASAMLAREPRIILRDFERRLREGTVLPTLADVRRFGQELSKDFKAAKSRKESLGRLLLTLATLSPEELRRTLARLPPKAEAEGSEPFRRLARQLMSGSSR